MPTDPIPGLELPAPNPTALQEAIEAKIAELERLGLIKPHHAAEVELCRIAARKLASIAEYGQAYGFAMVMRQLQDALASLPAVDTSDDERDQWNELVQALKNDG